MRYGLGGGSLVGSVLPKLCTDFDSAGSVNGFSGSTHTGSESEAHERHFKYQQ